MLTHVEAQVDAVLADCLDGLRDTFAQCLIVPRPARETVGFIRPKTSVRQKIMAQLEADRQVMRDRAEQARRRGKIPSATAIERSPIVNKWGPPAGGVSSV